MLGRLDPDGGIPLSRGQHRHGVQELVQAGQQVVSLLGLVGHVVEHLVRHHRRHGAPDLVVGLEVALGAQHHKQEPGGDGDLSEVTQDHGLLESDEGGQRFLQKLDLANQDVGGLSTLGDLLHEVAVNLRVRRLHSVTTTGGNDLVRIVPGQILSGV